MKDELQVNSKQKYKLHREEIVQFCIYLLGVIFIILIVVHNILLENTACAEPLATAEANVALIIITL